MAQPRSDAFRDHVYELLAPLGDVRVRAMFGGYGITADGAMFAFIAEGTLYLKVDERNEPRFVAAGLEQFEYASRNGPMKMAYRRAPDDGMDDGEVLREWARGAIDAALAKRKPAAKKPRAAKSAAPVAGARKKPKTAKTKTAKTKTVKTKPAKTKTAKTKPAARRAR